MAVGVATAITGKWKLRLARIIAIFYASRSTLVGSPWGVGNLYDHMCIGFFGEGLFLHIIFG